ncbi:MAG: nucleotide exchange factor GrpE [Deltaproteobacteria bacterium]|nr:nucleotide exchange factor GrpE [Deltaproteobacteria bacterium]
MKHGDRKRGRADDQAADSKAGRRPGDTGSGPPHSYAVEIPDGLLESAEESVDAPKDRAPASEEIAIEDDGSDAAPAQEVDRLKTEIDRLLAECAEMKDKALRAAAELENFRRRVLREKEDFQKFAAEAILRDLLPVADHVDAAMSHMGESPDLATLREGVEITYRGFLDVLRKKGVVPIDSKGMTFDPNIHEAVQMEPSDEVPPSCVVREVRRGYMLHDRLLRPALVVVSTGKAAPAAANGGPAGSDGDANPPAPECEE